MKKILLQFDTDPIPCSFDRVVAVDAGADELFSYGGITKENMTGLVHGAMFTRGGDNLKNTAIFVGGSDFIDGEELFEAVQKVFFGPVRVSVMHDSNGCNTTAAAAVIAAGRHLNLAETEALVLGGTGPVGERVVELLASAGAEVNVGSRNFAKAEAVCKKVFERVENAKVKPYTATGDGHTNLITSAQLVVSAGAAGVNFLTEEAWKSSTELKVAIDLNAVPPLGITGIDMMDKAVEKHDTICYGALGVGGTKMKIHKAAIGKLFESNDAVLGTKEIYEIGLGLE